MNPTAPTRITFSAIWAFLEMIYPLVLLPADLGFPQHDPWCRPADESLASVPGTTRLVLYANAMLICMSMTSLRTLREQSIIFWNIRLRAATTDTCPAST